METYYNPADLSKFADIGEDALELWKKFSEWYGLVFKEGALSEREKTSWIFFFVGLFFAFLKATSRRVIMFLFTAFFLVEPLNALLAVFVTGMDKDLKT